MMLSQQPRVGWRYVEWRIVRIRGRRTDSNTAIARVQSVWGSGLRFYSELRLPVDRGVVIHFAYNMGGKRREREGTIRQCVQMDNCFLYEAAFARESDDARPVETDFGVRESAEHKAEGQVSESAEPRADGSRESAGRAESAAHKADIRKMARLDERLALEATFKPGLSGIVHVFL